MTRQFVLICTIVGDGYCHIHHIPGFQSAEACNIAANNWLASGQRMKRLNTYFSVTTMEL